eukprot:TRINITY_DN5548_c0_g1_i1.p1 TRINITY_DN5548_c0_g1~~TRINITY_DN5548_c0_g1_i1.p1  ORF type:complete len:375 (+),score=102.80 TRINITY_DN5548_c0_g1_i1:63-1187(+)
MATIVAQANPNPPLFTSLIDLASERLGSQVLAVSDDFFAEASNLLKTSRPIFIPDKYTDLGKWMDGWESRRKRADGSWVSQEAWESIPADWCLIKLGASGVIHGFDIDTAHFLGNHAPAASVEAICVDAAVTAAELLSDAYSSQWVTVLSKKTNERGTQNFFLAETKGRFTHVKLTIYPDGGVARFRVYGDVVPSWPTVAPTGVADLASVLSGGLVLCASDMFFSGGNNLLMPGRGVTMGDGWETKRRRGPGVDWLVLRLGRSCKINKVVVDTCHFKGNYPYAFSLDVCALPLPPSVAALDGHERLAAERDIFKGEGSIEWKPLVAQTRLGPHAIHEFDVDASLAGADTSANFARITMYPDGGISRLRLFGLIA